MPFAADATTLPNGAPVVGLPIVEGSYYKDNAILSPLVRRVEAFARQTIGALAPGFAYHCVEHTEMVVHNACAIGEKMQLTSAQFDLVLSSAWLHDVGFSTTYLGHEAEGCRIAKELLDSEIGEEDMRTVQRAIMGTEIPQNAEGLVAMVLSDADLLYLGTSAFFPWSDRLRQEHRDILHIDYTDTEWIDVNLNFIRDQQFYTPFARDYCAEGCAHHLRLLEEMRRVA